MSRLNDVPVNQAVKLNVAWQALSILNFHFRGYDPSQQAGTNSTVLGV
jgi:hypothetical protein